jgi:hypothetical protein
MRLREDSRRLARRLRRLVAKIGCRRVQEEMGSLLRPTQVGFGTSGDAEAAVHTIRRFIDDKSPLVVIKLHFNNAFNEMRRDQKKDELPLLYRFVWQLYRHETFLSYGDKTLTSAYGVQQGDPLGPLLSCSSSFTFTSVPS